MLKYSPHPPDFALDTALQMPVIGPAPAGAPRPLFSVMVPVYNSTEFMGETLASVLCQDLGPEEMQIEVLDNCSTKGDPDKIVEAIGGGRIHFHRQPTNIGAIENFNSCIRRARGEWVHILHADDTVGPGFYLRAKQAIAANPTISAVAFRVTYINEHGKPIGLSELEAPQPSILSDRFVWRQLTAQRFQCVGMIVKRSAYEELGGFRLGFPHCTDWDMWNRLVLAKQIFYDPEPLACFRQHPGADSSNVFKSGDNVRDERRLIQLSARIHVSQNESQRLVNEAMKLAAFRAAFRARQFIRRGEWGAARRQIDQALHCCAAPSVIARLTYHVSFACVVRATECLGESMAHA